MPARQNILQPGVAILSCFCKIDFKCISFNDSKIWLNSDTTGADSHGSQSNAARVIVSRDTAPMCTTCAGEPARVIHHPGTKFQYVFWFSLWDNSRDGVVLLVVTCEEFIPNSELTLD